MKYALILPFLLVLVAYGSCVPTPTVAPLNRLEDVTRASDEVAIEAAADEADPSLLLSEPIDSATKMLIDLDEQVLKYLPIEKIDGSDEAPSTVSPQVYGAGIISEEADIAVRQEQQQQVSTLLDQLDALHNRLQETITQLVSRRQYLLSALIRPMATYVRRVRNNLERLQSRLTALSAAAPGSSGSSGSGNNPVSQGAIDNIRRQIEEITRRITDIVTRIRNSLTLGGPASNPTTPSGR